MITEERGSIGIGLAVRGGGLDGRNHRGNPIEPSPEEIDPSVKYAFALLESVYYALFVL